MTTLASPPSTPQSRFKPSLDWLLIFVPIAMALRWIPSLHNQTALFIVSCIAIIPLAGWMGKATEHLAEHLGQGVGGLLNATFGNAAELIIAMMALSRGLTDIVKASITGSIIGNVLLVLGLSFVAGGAKFSEQKFNRTAARSSATTLLLAGIALLIPSIFHLSAGAQWTPAKEQTLSLAIAVVLIATYGLTLYFSLRTHKQLFVGEPHGEIARATDEETHEHWSKGKSALILFIATAFVALISEFLVGAVESARTSLGLTEVFVGVIVVAIIGNAAEHSSAILMAMKNKMDLSVGIAVGSSIQIALFVAPILLFASYFIGPTRMDLEFSIPEIVAVLVAIGIAGQISGDGESNWLEGVQLLSVYIILGILFFFLPEVHHAAQNAVAPAAAH
jgi:Ca2+:H+ antiporter